MKALQIGAVVLAIIAVAGIVFFILSRGSSPTSTTPASTNTSSLPSVPQNNTNIPQTPDAFAAAFYKWYVRGYSNTPHFTTSAPFTSSIGQWLTPDFVANFSSMEASVGLDPVLFSQDYATTWLSNISTIITAQNSTETDVLVSLGTGSDVQKLNVRIVPFNGSWRVAGVSKAN